jgi:hypothetical protein
MHRHRHVGAAAPGPLTPGSDNAHLAVGAVEAQRSADTRDCAQADGQRKRIATLTARAALLGLELRPDADSWCLVQPFGTTVPLASLQAAEAIVYGCEQVRAEMGALAARLVPSKGLQRG